MGGKLSSYIERSSSFGPSWILTLILSKAPRHPRSLLKKNALSVVQADYTIRKRAHVLLSAFSSWLASALILNANTTTPIAIVKPDKIKKCNILWLLLSITIVHRKDVLDHRVQGWFKAAAYWTAELFRNSHLIRTVFSKWWSSLGTRGGPDVIDVGTTAVGMMALYHDSAGKTTLLPWTEKIDKWRC